MFHQESAEIFVPDGLAPGQALERTTHMGIGAHQDDLEIMAVDGILKCFQRDDRWFCGVVVTDGGGSPRDKLYASFSDAEMRAVRRREQKKAAAIGDYGAQVLLDYPSAAVKRPGAGAVVDDLERLIKAARPQVVYTHNLADKQDTHVAVALRVIEAIRRLPGTERPARLLGCEVWRDLDWLVDADKVLFDLSARENLQAALLGVFDSQISGGKPYALATMGRRRAHATFHQSHRTDTATGMGLAMDLTPLIEEPGCSVQAHVRAFIERLAQDVMARIAEFEGERNEFED